MAIEIKKDPPRFEEICHADSFAGGVSGRFWKEMTQGNLSDRKLEARLFSSPLNKWSEGFSTPLNEWSEVFKERRAIQVSGHSRPGPMFLQSPNPSHTKEHKFSNTAISFIPQTEVDIDQKSVFGIEPVAPKCPNETNRFDVTSFFPKTDSDDTKQFFGINPDVSKFDASKLPFGDTSSNSNPTTEETNQGSGIVTGLPNQATNVILLGGVTNSHDDQIEAAEPSNSIPVRPSIEFETGTRFYRFCVTARRDERHKTIDEVRDEIRKTLVMQQAKLQYKKLMNKVMRAAKIESSYEHSFLFHDDSEEADGTQPDGGEPETTDQPDK